jgi:hypothetical protein
VFLAGVVGAKWRMRDEVIDCGSTRIEGGRGVVDTPPEQHQPRETEADQEPKPICNKESVLSTLCPPAPYNLERYYAHGQSVDNTDKLILITPWGLTNEAS